EVDPAAGLVRPAGPDEERRELSEQRVAALAAAERGDGVDRTARPQQPVERAPEPRRVDAARGAPESPRDEEDQGRTVSRRGRRPRRAPARPRPTGPAAARSRARPIPGRS